jgi:mitogen-activated protein kinase kinase
MSDLEGTLSPGSMSTAAAMGLDFALTATADASPLPLPPKRAKKKAPTSKKDKRKSQGVSLQGGGMTMSILELLQHIVGEPAPRLTPEGKFPKKAEDFIDQCLLKDPDERPTPKDLLVSARSARSSQPTSLTTYLLVCRNENGSRMLANRILT